MTQEKNNLSVWDSFPKTDERYTKKSNVDGHVSTSIAATYMVKLATEAFGPIGIGWGYDVVEERFDNTSPLTVDGQILMDNGSIVWGQTHTMRINLWHSGSKENYITQYGHTKYRYMTKNGYMMTDTEVAKKTLTDAMKKCLSLLGICSDVFMGEFDDAEYREQAKLENSLAKADKRDEEYISKTEELRDFVTDKVNAISLCPNMDAVSKIYGLAANRIDRQAPVLGLDPQQEKQALDQAFFDKRKQMEQK